MLPDREGVVPRTALFLAVRLFGPCLGPSSYATSLLHGASWVPLGGSWGPLWGLLGACWAVLGPSWNTLGPSWAVLGHLGRLEGRWGTLLVPTWGRRGGLFGHLGALLGLS